jgi:predicted ferric reductase
MFIIVILSAIPVIIWAFMEPLGLRFSGLNSITTSLGQIFGLVGMVLFSINLILAGRFKWLDKYFKGLDKVYVNHAKLGAISFSFLLFHPLFLVVKYVTFSIRDAGMFFVPFVNMPITWGIISLLLMILLICLTFYFRMKYQNWKLSHKFMVVVFIFAIMHTFLISSDISRNNLLRYYILILAISGLIISIRKAFVDKFLNNKFKYKVIKGLELNKDILEIEMEPLNNKMSFESGQFAFFSFISGLVGSESHPFSISSSNKENNLKITVKNLGDYTSQLKNIKNGDLVLIEGPFGHFSYKNYPGKNQIWIAGGIGITPFFSMAQNLESDYHVDLFYAVKESNEAIYIKEFMDIMQNNSNFKFTLWDSSKNGYINAGSVSTVSGGLNDKDIFFCGPPPLMESLEKQFVSLDVDIKKIHYENFNFN